MFPWYYIRLFKVFKSSTTQEHVTRCDRLMYVYILYFYTTSLYWFNEVLNFRQIKQNNSFIFIGRFIKYFYNYHRTDNYLIKLSAKVIIKKTKLSVCCHSKYTAVIDTVIITVIKFSWHNDIQHSIISLIERIPQECYQQDKREKMVGKIWINIEFSNSVGLLCMGTILHFLLTVFVILKQILPNNFCNNVILNTPFKLHRHLYIYVI